MKPNCLTYLLSFVTLTFISSMVRCSSIVLLSSNFTLPASFPKIYCQEGDTLEIKMETEGKTSLVVTIERQESPQQGKQFLAFSQFQGNSTFLKHIWLSINYTGYYKLQVLLLQNSIPQTSSYKLTASTDKNKTEIQGNVYGNWIGVIFVIEEQFLRQSNLRVSINTSQSIILKIIQNDVILQDLFLSKGKNTFLFETKNKQNVIFKMKQVQQTQSIINGSIFIQMQQNDDDIQNMTMVAANQTENETEQPNDSFLFNRTAFWILSIASPVVLLILIVSLFCYCRCNRRRREQQYEPRQWQPAPSNYFDFLQSAQVLNQSADPLMICSVCLQHECNVTLPCNHSFHNECIREWVNRNRNCPNCRKDVIRMYGMEN